MKASFVQKLVLVVGLVTLVGCGPDAEMERLRRTVQTEYDAQTGRLSQITYDSNDDHGEAHDPNRESMQWVLTQLLTYEP